MPLALPAADERTFASLVDDARARIPRLAPQWTDHNAHDPGITLIELFAYLTELDLFRLARITARERRAFLRWFGIESRGPAVAHTTIALRPSAGMVAALVVPTDGEITSNGAAPAFSTTASVSVQPVSIAGLEVGGQRVRATIDGGVVALSSAPLSPLGTAGVDAFVIALSAAVTGDIDLYLWTGASDHDDDERRRLSEEMRERMSMRKANPSRCPDSRFDDATRHYAVDVVWELRAADGWHAADDVTDETRALSLSGRVHLHASRPVDAIRVRVASGMYDAPPMIAGVLLNAAPARHQSRAFDAVLGTSDGTAGQVFPLPRGSGVPEPRAPLVVDRTHVTVTALGDVAVHWNPVPDLDRSGPNAMDVVLMPEDAQIRFGDGRAGAVPPAGASIELASRVGGGPEGNVAPRTLNRWQDASAPPQVLEVLQPFPGRGGADAPDLFELQASVIARLNAPWRATTLDDIERLARQAPGLPIARARAVADYHPEFPDLPAAGCVTLVVVPRAPGSAPKPTTALLAAMRAYLGRRRPLTTELHVVAPTYTKIAVRARLHLALAADAATVTAEANRRLNAFLHPLEGGPDGDGWPVGRAVYRGEVLALLQGVPGVHHVDELFLLVGDDRFPACDNVCVCPTDLVAAQPHELTVAAERIR